MTEIEQLAKAFCEASGARSWEDTPKYLQRWYIEGVKAVLEQLSPLLIRPITQ